MAAATEEVKVVKDPEPEQDPARLARKRRRKTQSNGAVEDCFACQKRQQQCDRRRPYCSQCLEYGKDCSGYRTVLTWGVGVASRGKLRGMSLPIPMPGNTKPSGSAAAEANRRRTSMNAATQEQGKNPANQARITRKRSTSTTIKSEFSDVGFGFMPPASHTTSERPPALAHQNHWQLPPLRTLVADENNLFNHQQLSHSAPIPELSASRSNSLDESPLSSSASSLLSSASMSSYGDTYDQPFGSGPNSADMQFPDSYSNTYMNDTFRPPPPQPLISPTEDFAYHIESPQVQDGYVDHNFNGRSCDTAVFTEQMCSASNGEQEQDNNFTEMDSSTSDVLEMVDSESQIIHSSSLSHHLPRSSFSVPLYHLAPRMQYLLDYYDKVICPVLVAFDGPTNPYRMYMMQLASQNAGLQSAIAALVTNNIRMRNPKKTTRIKSETAGWESNGEELVGPSAEEQLYKTRSIEHLNAQLANPIKARDDSVLATLLILCLFHVSDSGFSKFKTQLAGVQKLLRMRGQVFHSEFVGWVEVFFAWFDVMTSTVNDREIQVHGDSLDLMNLSANLGALEQFCGCDGRLFKLLARLGRLNLLSQNRNVRDSSDLTPRASPQLRATGQPMSPMDLYTLQDDDMMGDIQCSSTIPEPVADPDGRTNFWHEWRDVRQKLQEWESDHFYMTTPSEELPQPQRDLLHISESFRYAALLYTERLGYPDLPSSNQNFQDLVAQSLFHITEIGMNSCVTKFLLWPLFITGTECVDERHRDLIRNGCLEIMQESGFYNNLSGLEVLEKVWKEVDEDTGEVKRDPGSQAFRWRMAMDRVDGEYIMI